MTKVVADTLAWMALVLAVAWFLVGLRRVQRTQSMEKEWVPAAVVAWAAVAWLIVSSRI